MLQTDQLDILNSLLPAHACLPTSLQPSEGGDVLQWSFSLAGSFCVKTYLHLNEEAPASPIRYVWQSWVPLATSVFAWKLWKRALPTDDRVMDLGISLVSKCYCCSAPKQETITHLFVLSDSARLVWEFFSPIFNKPSALSLSQMYKFWVLDSSISSQLGCLAIATFLIGVWEIWNLRNQRRHEEQPQSTIRAILRRLRDVNFLINPKSKPSFEDSVAIAALQLDIKVPPCKTLKWVAWSPCNGITANLEISSDARKGSALLRNNLGKFLHGLVFDVSTSCRFANLFYGIRRVIDFCHRKHIVLFQLQCTSGLVCRWLKNPEPWPWLWFYDLKECRMYLDEVIVKHIPKCANKGATSLLCLDANEYSSLSEMPRDVRAVLALDEARILSLDADPD